MNSTLDQHGPQLADAEWEAWLDEINRPDPEMAAAEDAYWDRWMAKHEPMDDSHLGGF